MHDLEGNLKRKRACFRTDTNDNQTSSSWNILQAKPTHIVFILNECIHHKQLEYSTSITFSTKKFIKKLVPGPASSRFFKKCCSRFPRERSLEDSRLRSSRRSLLETMKIRVSNLRLLLSFFVLTLLRSRKI